MVIAQLLGGMGNQMFQYALGKQLSLSNNSELKLDTSILLDWRPGKHAVNRGFDLDIFNLKPVLANKKEIGVYHPTLMSLPEKVIFKIRNKISPSAIVSEKYFHFDPSVLELKGDLYFSGVWQSYKYFDKIEDQIRNDFEFSTSLSDQSVELLSRIKAAPSVCLNVRRADYITVVSTAQTMGAIGLDYYKEALRLMKEWIGEFNVFIFSDDIQWCREHLIFIDSPLFFVDHSYAGYKFNEYLQLMKACDHYIIPNSTFAWWGAWLNKEETKKVIAPKKWMNDPSVDTSDLIPSEWVRI